MLADVAIQLPELAAAGAGVVSVARDADGELMVRCLKARQRRERPTRAEQLRAERRLARGGARRRGPRRRSSLTPATGDHHGVPQDMFWF